MENEKHEEHRERESRSEDVRKRRRE